MLTVIEVIGGMTSVAIFTGWFLELYGISEDKGKMFIIGMLLNISGTCLTAIFMAIYEWMR